MRGIGVLLLMGVMVGAEEPAFRPPSAAQINAAIDRGVAYLRSAQLKDGSWGPCVGGTVDYSGRSRDPRCHHHGPTAFAIYTLAKCGAGPKDKTVRKGLRWLKKHATAPAAAKKRFGSLRSFDSYESAAMVLALTALHTSKKQLDEPRMSSKPGRPPPGRRFSPAAWKWMDEHVRFLCSAQMKSSGWRYWSPNNDVDCSATQFVLLALRAAARAGYPVEKVQADVWRGAAQATLGLRSSNGGFRYQKVDKWSAGMTAAGIASLYLCKEQLALAGQPPVPGLDAAIDKGLKFLGPVWRVDRNVTSSASLFGGAGGQYHYYHLYAIERVGALSGKREIGKRAWYPRGAAYLIKEQSAETGSWIDATGMKPHDVLGTCFALLFLKKATIPTLTTR